MVHYDRILTSRKQIVDVHICGGCYLKIFLMGVFILNVMREVIANPMKIECTKIENSLQHVVGEPDG